MALLGSSEISEHLGRTPKWRLDGDAIVRTFQFPDFAEAVEFVNAVAEAAESAWHHPDIDIRWNKVTLRLSTHSEGGLTNKDFELARALDMVHGEG